MVLNKQKGNMYGFVTHTFNVIKGKCKHDCAYCYMKRFPQKELWFDSKELKTDLGQGNFIFVGSSTDMFADDVPDEWIIKVLEHCRKFDNKYLFQSKNVYRMLRFREHFPETDNCIWATTIETNRHICKLSEAPNISERILLKVLPNRMVTIEPILDFDLEVMLEIIKEIGPRWVNIGADSNTKREYNFPEPSKEKVLKLIEELKKFTEVKSKDNLSRILSK